MRKEGERRRDAERPRRIETTLWELAEAVCDASGSDREACVVLETLLAESRLALRAGARRGSA